MSPLFIGIELLQEGNKRLSISEKKDILGTALTEIQSWQFDVILDRGRWWEMVNNHLAPFIDIRAHTKDQRGDT